VNFTLEKSKFVTIWFAKLERTSIEKAMITGTERAIKMME
jgi:hypothetical protein